MTNRKGISKKESAAARRRRIKLLRDRAAKIGLEKPADARETGSGGRRRSAKVISKGKASLVISGAEDVRKEVSRPKQFAPEPRIVTPRKREQPEESPPEKEEPVVISRLESKVRPGKERIKVDKAKFEKLQQRPDEAEVREEEWGRAASPGWWVALAGVSAIVLLLAALAVKSWLDEDEAGDAPPAVHVEPEPDPYEGSPEKWFRDRAGRIAEQARAVMDGYAHAQSISERSKYVRFPDTYRQRVTAWPKPVSPCSGDTSNYKIDVQHTGETAFLTVDCLGADFLPFRGYFVHDGDRLKLDWAATVAWSEASLAKMKSDIRAQQTKVHEMEKNHRRATEAYRVAMAKRAEALLNTSGEQGQENAHADTGAGPGVATIPPAPAEVPPLVLPAPLYAEPVLVRCLIRRKDEFYAGPYNDTSHSAFMLTSPDGVSYMWAYTERDSALDLELRRMLDHGRFVVDLKKDVRVTVRVMREKKDALPSQLKLVELVHPEWVKP